MRGLILVAGLLCTLTASTLTSAAEEVTERAVPGPSSTLQQPALPPRATIPALTMEQQLAALQQQVQSLQAQVAALQSVFKVTAGGATIQAPSLSFISAEGTLIQSGKDIAISASRDVTVSAGSTFKVASAVATIQPQALSLSSTMGTTIQSSKGIAITAGTGLAMQSQTGTSLKAGSSMLVETSGTLDLKAAVTRLNGGNKPIATVGSAVGNGLILTGSQTILGN